MRTLVAGVDSSTQSCKVVVRDAHSGELLRSGAAAHPNGTEVDPEVWWVALREAVKTAGGLEDVAAVAVAGQQHGMVALDDTGATVRPALLWNDIRSAQAAADLVAELGHGDLGAGATAWASATGSVPVASYTVTKLRWLAQHEPSNAARTAAIALPHDWLTWRLAGATGLDMLTTDRSDASGTGYWSPTTGTYRTDLLSTAFGRTDVLLPRVLGPHEVAGLGNGFAAGVCLGPGAGDNAAAALGLGLRAGDVAISIGTSGVVSAVSTVPTADVTGAVSGFCDATGQYLPLACTLNASRVLDAAARMLQVDHDELSRLALTGPAGSDGLVLVPYLEGERTPNRPDATGALHGLTLRTSTASHLARATVEGLLCGLADGLDALIALGVPVERLLLIGGGAQSEAVRRIAPTVFGRPVSVPAPGQYVADGAARQAAWVLAGTAQPPDWNGGSTETYDGPEHPEIRTRYAALRDLTSGS